MTSSLIKTGIGLILLCALGILMVFSTAPQLAIKQAISWVIGIILFFIGKKISTQFSLPAKIVIFTFSILLLLIPLVQGRAIRGSQRWLEVGPLSLQPSELVKAPLLLFFANTTHVEFALIPILLTLLQPDLSGAFTMALLAIPAIIFNKKLLKICLIGFFALIVVSPLIWTKGLKSYQKDRIVTFLNPSKDPLGKGYNVIQSKIAIGSGGLFGRGYRQGSQGQLRFLPEKHTDFIFASLAEELGFVGVLTLLFSFGLVFWGLLSRYQETSQRERKLFIFGILIQLWLQFVANLGMNTGILPVSGVPLPFISVGGSAIMALLFALGICFSD